MSVSEGGPPPRLAIVRVIPTVLAGLAMALGMALARPAPITAPDLEQPRLDVAAPLPSMTAPVTQGFTPLHNGLSGVEVLAVVYTGAPAEAALTLEVLRPDGTVAASQRYQPLQHNQPLRLAFAPEPNSAGVAYTLRVLGTPAHKATVWAYGLDGYAAGAAAAGQPLPGDLKFSVTYTYLPAAMAADLGRLSAGLGGLALALAAVLAAPGLALLGWRGAGAAPDGWAHAGLVVAVSVAFLPVVWLWAGVLGLRLTGPGLLGLYAALGLVAAVRLARTMRHAPLAFRPGRPAVAMGVVVVVGLAVRLLAIRDLAFPPWVDSPHHLLIARLLAEAGQVPASYQPLLPVDAFSYHFGYHVLAVAIHWWTGQAWPEVMLGLGQVLNALAPLAVYAFVRALTGRPGAAVAAAWAAGWVSYFPGYYLSWGRYTQLAGWLIGAPLLGLVWGGLAAPAATRPERWRQTLALSLLLAGLGLTHYRVAAYCAPFILLAWAAHRGRGLGWLAAAGGLALGLTAPWLWQLAGPWFLPVLQAPEQLRAVSGLNDFPYAYFETALERGWLSAAGVGAALAAWRQARGAWVLIGWVALVFALLNLGPGTWLVNNNAWAISLFVPAAAGLGWGMVIASEGLLAAGRRWPAPATLAPRPYLAPTLAWLGWAAGFAMLGAASVLGLRTQIAMLNQATVLALPADREALTWARAHLPAEAVVLNNAWKWQGEIWAGSDGGSWLWAWAERRATTPPVDYAYQAEWVGRVEALNTRLNMVTDGADPALRALIREAGVTHIFIGARGGPIRPEMLASAPGYVLRYTNGAAWVFEVVP